ncbi:hypothetical protein ACE6H2_001114 [Prunus campanulata]
MQFIGPDTVSSGLKIIIEGDSQTLIHILCKRSQCPWNVAAIIKDIQLIAEDFEEILFRHVSRKANRAADGFANIGQTRADTIGVRTPRGSKFVPLLVPKRKETVSE